MWSFNDDQKKSQHSAQKAPGAQHEVLVNKRTKKVSSSNNWLIALAARAVNNQDNSGIAALLPQAKAQKLLQANDLVTKTRRGLNNGLSDEKAREQAERMIPILANEYLKYLPKNLLPRRNHFCEWIVLTLKDSSSEATKYAVNQGYDELIDTGNKARWWHDQVATAADKLQS